MTSEIRVNKIENRSGLGTVTFADTGVDLAGIVTATTFSGSGASLTNVPDSALSAVTASKLTGVLPALNAASLTQIPAANLVGVCTSGLTKTGGFGKILQVVTGVALGTASISSSTFAEITTDLRCTITPTSASSKIIVTANLCLSMGGNLLAIRILKDGTTMVNQPTGFNSSEIEGNAAVVFQDRYLMHETVQVIETAGSTDSRYYTPFWARNTTSSITGYFNRWYDSTTHDATSSITVMEVAA